MLGVPRMRKSSCHCIRKLRGLTCSRQWGNVLTLLAASVNPLLRDIVSNYDIKELYENTMGFLAMAGQPSSALRTDRKILEHAAKEANIIPKGPPTGSSFSSNSGDVPMSGN